MKRVLLLNPPGRQPYIRDNYCSYSSKANYFWEPIDLLVQSAWLKDRFELSVLDAVALGLGPGEVTDRARAGGCDAVVSLTGSVSLKEDEPLFRRLKEATGAMIAVSGDLCLTDPEKALERLPAVDAALKDYTVPDLAEFLEAGPPDDGRAFEALAYRAGGEVVAPRAEPDRDAEMDYPVPRHDLFPIDRYRISTSVHKRFVTCIASLGCNFNCPFCICSVMTPRLRAMDSLLAELRAVRRMGIREVYFYDPNFTVSRRRCVEMLEAIIAEDLGLVFSCNSHITVSEEVLDLLARAGCHTAMFGIESADEKLLKRYSKGITRERTIRTLDRCKARGIRTFGYFLIGMPDETEASIRETIRFSTDLNLNYASFNLPSPIEGTELYREAKEKGLLRTEERNLDRSTEVSIRLPGVADERLLKLKRLAYRRFYLRPLFLLRTLRVLYPRRKWSYFVKDVLTFLRRNFL